MKRAKQVRVPSVRIEPVARFGNGSYAVVDVAQGGGEILLGKDFGTSLLLVDRTGSLQWAFNAR